MVQGWYNLHYLAFVIQSLQRLNLIIGILCITTLFLLWNLLHQSFILNSIPQGLCLAVWKFSSNLARKYFYWENHDTVLTLQNFFASRAIDGNINTTVWLSWPRLDQMRKIMSVDIPWPCLDKIRPWALSEMLMNSGQDMLLVFEKKFDFHHPNH